jgi:hypothetical protein
MAVGPNRFSLTRLGQQPTAILPINGRIWRKIRSNLMTDDKLQGEGNYEAAREYDQKVIEFAKDKGKVKRAAEAAKAAIDGPEKEELEAAEKEGERHARH